MSINSSNNFILVGMNYGNYIGGEWIESGKPVEQHSNFERNPVGSFRYATKEDWTKALVLANSSKKQVTELTSYQREQILQDIANQLAASRSDFAKLIVLESGKPLMYAIGEVDRAIQTFKIAAEETKRLPKEYIDLDWTPAGKGKEGLVKYFPVGTVLAITPFNFPLNLVAHKVAPAIAAGCAIIVKPSPRTPLTALKLAQVIDNTDLPKGAFSTLVLKNEDVEACLADDRIKMVSFTGSPKVGWDIKSKAGTKRVALELGGNAGVIVASDADVLWAVKRCVLGGFAYSGQVCIHTQRIYVNELVYDLFVETFIKEVERLQYGDPMNEETDISNMIDEQNAIRIENWVKDALVNGATLLHGGKRKGCYMEPTVLTNTRPEDKVVCEEVFGPVVIVEKYKRFKSAVAEINSSKFGLQAAIFSNNKQYIDYCFETMEVGGVIVNDVPTFRVDHMPYGGIKDSGFGREGVKYAIREMMEPKLLVM